MNRIASICCLAGVVSLAGFASAATVYDTTLASPNTVTPPSDGSWYNGAGNPQGGFTVETDNGIELGLRAKLRQDPNPIHSANEHYVVPAGSQPGQPTRASWNYEFSYDLSPLNSTGTSARTIANTYLEMTVTDLTTGDTITFDARTKWADNSTYGAGPEHTGIGSYSVDWGLQNSENPAFGDFPLNSVPGYTYDMNLAHSYEFILRAYEGDSTTARLLATDRIVVDVVAPLPNAAGMGVALVGLMGVVRRRKA